MHLDNLITSESKQENSKQTTTTNEQKNKGGNFENSYLQGDKSERNKYMEPLQEEHSGS